jgi:transcriptional regulator with XRE-family HTH domain
MSRKFPHYLRSERKRAGLSQSDIAALLGDETVSRVSRYERRRRVPPLLTALAYEAIFGKPVAELFDGTYAPIQAEVIRRAKLLAEKLNAGQLQLHESRKRSIQTIATRQ